MKKNNIAATVKELIQPTADELGYILWDVEYLKEGPNMILRITIDKQSGIDPDDTGEENITIDDCEKIHRAIDPILDEANLIEDAYHLEVSSPGLERDLKTESHFKYAVGKKVEIRLFASVGGRKTINGVLESFEGDAITVKEANGDLTQIKRAGISKASTVFDFSSAFRDAKNN